MSRQTHKRILLCLLVCSLLFSPQRARACGPFSLEAVFTYSKHPDFPLERFARGELGILQPAYARSYLLTAYRHLSGTGANAAEQQALVSLWKDRLDFGIENDVEDWTKPWLVARKRVIATGEAPKLSLYRAREKPNDYDTYLNCQKDAFVTARRTLEERIKKYGADSAAVKSWVEAQDTVFNNCGEGNETPAPLADAGDALMRADRAYQIAAAHFYAARYDEARRAFEEIARDAASPWKTKAPYLVARTLLRKGSLSENPVRNEALAEAEQQFRKVLGDPSLRESHEDALKLLNLTRLRLNPQARLKELAEEVVRPNAQRTLKQDVWDYTVLLDKFEEEAAPPTSEIDAPPKFKDLPKVGRENDLTDWLLTFEATDTEAVEYALQKWRKSSATHWLIAALTNIEGTHPAVASLLEAAGRIKADSPAYPSVAFHTARLLVAAGRDEEARTRLDALISADRAGFPPSALNHFRGLRMLVARDLDEFLRFAQRYPSAFSYNDDGRELPISSEEVSKDEQLKPFAEGRTMFDSDSVSRMNQLFPLSLLKEAANSRTLPEHLRRDVLLAAWVRSVLLGDRETDRQLVPLVLVLVPELKGFVDADLDAASPDQRKYAAIYAILKFPGLQPYVDAGRGRETPLKQIDNYRDNWWCSFAWEAGHRQTGEEQADAGSAARPAPKLSVKFLNEMQRSAVARERTRLAAIGNAPEYLARMAIEWSERTPEDPRVPEALHLAVKSTRYGCTDKGTGALSKAAFQALHRRYPKSEWAKKTPYWFKE